MENTNPNPTIQEPVLQPQQEIPVTFKGKLKIVFNKAYKHKAAFWSITSLFALIILIIIAGSVYKLINKTGDKKEAVGSPTPVGTTVVNNEEVQQLDLIEGELNKIETELTNMDIFQKKLQPPSVDYKVDF